jgi:tetratricopeptide (TPR) repeat protein
MKQKWILITLVIFALTACTSPDHEAMRQRLKYVSDCNRADTVFTERWLPTVDSLVTYFDRHGSANDRMMAHYVQGRVHHDMGEAPQALECYQRAAEQADTTSNDCDLYTLYAVYGQMANIFHSQYLPDDEMQALIAAERIAWKDKDTLTALNTYELRIRPFFLKSDTDSILLIARDAYSRFQKHHSISKSITSLPILINICIAQNKVKEAFKWISIYEHESDHFDDNGNIIPGREVYYYDKGKYELAQGRLDSATVLFQRALRAGFKEAGYRGLLSVYEKKNYPDSIAKYAKLFAAANDSSYLHVNQNTVHQISAMYNYSRQQQMAEAEKQKAQEWKYRTFMLISAILAIAFCFATYRARKLETIKKLMQTKEELTSLLEQKDADIHRVEQEKRGRNARWQRTLNEETRRLQLQIESLKVQLMERTKANTDTEALEAIIKEFQSKYQTYHNGYEIPTSQEWEKLRFAFKGLYGNAYDLISSKGILKDDQILICILVMLNFSESTIAVMLQTDSKKIDRKKRQINKKLFDEESASTLKVNLQAYI